MLKANVESDRFAPLFSSGWRADPKKNSRLGYVLVGAVLAHAALLGLVAWSERRQGGGGATSAVEIPVEMASVDEAEGRPETGQAREPAKPSANPPASPPASPPAAIEPRDETRPQPPQSARNASGGAADAPKGQVVERPKESDLPQAAGARGADTKIEEPKEEAANPFGGLAAVEKPAPVEPTPTFLSPQALMAPARPRPAPDPKNDNYRAKVLGKVAANMIDPERPRPKALAIVGFRIDAQGALENVWLARPTGSAELDAEAVDMVRRSAPFPTPPTGAERNFAAAIAFGGD